MVAAESKFSGCEGRLWISTLRFILGVLSAFYIYLTYSVWWIDNHNDFGEYLTRAELWSRGLFTWSGGSDKLLSLLELIPAYLFSRNLDALYIFTKLILLSLLGISLSLFIASNNRNLPNWHIRLFAVLVVIIHPVFAIISTSVDPSIPFLGCLLLFISFYKRKYIAVGLAVLVAYSRPEGILVFPLFVLLGLIENEGMRRDIFRSALSSILIFIVLKACEVILFGRTQEFDIINSAVEIGFWKSIANLLFIPIVPVLFASEVFPGYPCMVIFLLGYVANFRNKSYWIIYSILFLQSILTAVLYHSAGLMLVDKVGPAWSRLAWWGAPLSITIGTDQVLGARYIIPYYPFLAIFLVSGASLFYSGTIKALSGLFPQYANPRGRSIFAIGAAIVASGMLLATFQRGYQELIISGKYFWPYNISSLNHAAIQIRALREAEEAVLFDGICDDTNGSLLSEFSVHSGVVRKYIAICGGRSAFGYVDSVQRVLKSEDIDQIGSDRFGIFHDFTLDVTTTRDALLNGTLRALRELEESALGKHRVRFVISRRKLSIGYLRYIGEYGDYNLYEAK
ncbi:hypothetical protein [Microvirga puerhi]|uniref:Glycosyltransferase RgtA/B/C/D-like domain-containing protein n=1 Tax=Microvirga puerhi TaxID=2876078 RepID=A0ABS7VMT2_9HYPH|nr:hypothetical protein [Microvirga puerhi]MBZ6076253.1 hypothetical protein [Microvirga puerhi]